MTVSLNIIDTGPSKFGWHKHELILLCTQKYAWAKLGDALQLDGKKLSELAHMGVPPPAGPLLRGTLLHIALAHHYELTRRGNYIKADATLALGPTARSPAALLEAPLQPHDALEHMIAEYENAWPGCTDEFRAFLRRAVTAYIPFYADTDSRWEILGAEVLYAETVEWNRESTPFTQRIDLVVRDPRSGLIYYGDHKGTARIDAKVRARYTLSGQFLAMQHFGLKRHGREFGGVFANLVGMNPLRFERPPQAPAPFALARWPRDILFASNMMRRLEMEFGTDPTNWPGSPSEMTCFTAYGPCTYFDRCRFGRDFIEEGGETPMNIADARALVASSSGEMSTDALDEEI